ncbi:helix-turn-helix domain-containing protein [Humidesulfovibrio idahonensis]
MELTEQAKDKISKCVWLKFYPRAERHPLIKALEKLGTPHKEIADALGISKQALNYYLAGERPLPRKHFRRLSLLLVICIHSARQVLAAMERNNNEEALGPNSRKATDSEVAELQLVIQETGALLEKFNPLTINFLE